jgi:formate C-acetyltransferase
MKSRTQAIKERLPIKNYRSTLRGYDQEDTSNAYRPGVKLCLDRARLYTESYKQTEGEPTILRRAKALAHILENMTIYISEGEIIVGNYASSPAHLTYHPEYYWRWVEKAVNNGYRALLDDEGRELLHGIVAYWQNKAVHGRERNYLPAELKPYWAYNGATFWGHFAESGVPDYEMILKKGFNGLIREAQEKLEAISKDQSLSLQDYIEQKNFLEAVIIVLKAAITWANRYAEKAKEIAQTEVDDVRKRELETIAEVCQWVPANPARSFHEALQTFYFIHVITHLIEAYNNGIGTRFDQVMFPYYQQDRQTGRLSREQAQELLELLWLKMEEMGVLFAPMLGGGVQGSSLFQTLTLGGITPSGEDGVNELTYIILDACDSMRLSQPTTAIRIHHNTSKEFLLRVTDSIRKRWGTVSLFNDEYMIPKLLSLGIPLADARNYGIEQCMRWTIPGKNIVYRAGDGMIILPKCLELALNRGIDKFSGKQLGAPTPDPNTFKSIEEVMDALITQVGFFAPKVARIANTADILYEQYLPRPFLSALFDGGIQAGKDCRKWSYFPKRIIGFLGGINTANALAAIQKLVFEEKKISMAELVEAMNNNFSGREDLRQLLLNCPKYGNDDDYADWLAKEVQCRATKEVEKVKNNFGHHFIVDGSSGSAYYAFSQLVGASADGRRDRDLFADGTASPVAGTDKKGPTAVLKSVSKLDPLASFNHLLNQKFLPQFLEGPNKEAFVSYLKAWCELGIHHIQFNIMDQETLRDAQEHPDKYSDLVVRVAGYAAYFVDLARPLQDEIIKRAEQALA